MLFVAKFVAKKASYNSIITYSLTDITSSYKKSAVSKP